MNSCPRHLSLQEIMKLHGKEVSVICTDGGTVTGTYYIHLSEMDNEPDGEAIVIKTDKWLTEVAVAEIVSIQEVKE